MSRLLFITLSNIGDLVMTTPALMALHEAFPDSSVDIVADTRSSELLQRCPFLGEMFHRIKADGRAGLLQLIRQLRYRRYEAIVDLRTDFLPWVLRADRRSARWQAGQHGPHAVEQHYAVASRVLPSSLTAPACHLWLGEQDIATAQRTLAAAPGSRRLVMAPGANWPGKCWPAAHYAALIHLLRNDFDSVVLLGSVSDAATSTELLADLSIPSLNLMGRTPLLAAAALIQQGTLFIGNDSGLGHIAAAVNTPSLTLFGPGRPERYRPWGPRAAVVLAPSRALPDLRPEQVATRARDHLSAVAG